jgi:hypothetical protein
MTSYSKLSSCFPGYPSRPGYVAELYYSPAICPLGYSVDCTATYDELGVDQLPGETAVVCCPRCITRQHSVVVESSIADTILAACSAVQRT